MTNVAPIKRKLIKGTIYILSDSFIFGCNLYEVGAAETVTEIFRELNAGPGAVRKTLEKYTALAKNA